MAPAWGSNAPTRGGWRLASRRPAFGPLHSPKCPVRTPGLGCKVPLAQPTRCTLFASLPSRTPAISSHISLEYLPFTVLPISLLVLVYAGESSPQFQIKDSSYCEGEFFLSMWPTRTRPQPLTFPQDLAKIFPVTLRDASFEAGSSSATPISPPSHPSPPVTPGLTSLLQPCGGNLPAAFPCSKGYQALQTRGCKRSIQILVLAGLPFRHL